MLANEKNIRLSNETYLMNLSPSRMLLVNDSKGWPNFKGEKKDSEPCILWSNFLPYEKNEKEAVDEENIKDNLVELSTVIVIRVDEYVLSKIYKCIGDEIVHDEVWD